MTLKEIQEREQLDCVPRTNMSEPTHFVVYADDGAIYGVGKDREAACRDAYDAMSDRITDALADALGVLERNEQAHVSFDLHVIPASQTLITLVEDRGGDCAWHIDSAGVGQPRKA